MTKRVILLGSSGSIGQSACKVARAHPHRMKIVGMAVNGSVETLLEQTEEFLPDAVAITDKKVAEAHKHRIRSGCKLFSGHEGLVQLVEEVEADMVLVAIVGTAGLLPALAALRSGKDLAVASKEILVMAGQIVTHLAQEQGRAILPVDSEHNAIFQCLQGASIKQVERLILTASGGPFRQTPASEFESITVEQALRHPTWKMGKKITIDSATFFNKGLEMIEAHWLFGVEMGRISVVIHPESIIHSMVEFIDRSVIAQMNHTDMCFPIQYAVTYPDRLPNDLPPLNFENLRKLTFEPEDPVRFPALRLSREAAERGGTLPAVLNGANEEAVQLFLDKKISFPQIWHLVQLVMHDHHTIDKPSLEDILEADRWAKQRASWHYARL